MNNVYSIILVIFGTILSHQHVYGNPNGAPKSACDLMIPNHGVSPQEGKSHHHFTIAKEGSYDFFPGEKVNISLFVTESENESKFKGFMIQVKN